MEDIFYNINKSKCPTIQDGFKKLSYRDFPGSPVVKTWHFQQCTHSKVSANGPRVAPCSSFQPRSNIYPGSNLQNQPLSCLWSPGPANTIKKNFFLAKLLITNQPWVPRFVRIISLRCRPPSLCTCWPPTPTHLWASLSTSTMWLWRVGVTFSSNWPRGSTNTSWKCKTSAAPGPSSQTCRSSRWMG